MTTIRIAGTNDEALTDGPGLRFSIYTQGCSIRCPGCQVPHLWNRNGGREVDVQDLAREAAASGLPVSILGGEPMDQPQALYELLFWIRDGRPDKGVSDVYSRPRGCPQFIVIYTGYTLEDLLARGDDFVDAALFMADVLVDGPFIQDQDDDYLQYRGSRNQRVIDLKATLANRDRAPVLID
jgi:anaerobic ribonucleoside-triphosphate reductase activating protein